MDIRCVGNTLLELIEDRAQELENAPLYSFLDRSLRVEHQFSYVDLYQRAQPIAAKLQELGLQRHPVILFYPHGPEFIAAFFGCILAAVYPMPVTRPRGSDWSAIVSIVTSSNASAILAPESKREQIMQALGSDNELQFVGTDAIPLEMGSEWKRPSIKESDIAFIQYTSGSTSKPKGVVITHKNIIANSAVIQRNFRSGHQDIGIGWLPFFHDMGLIGHVIKPLYARIHNYFLSPITFAAKPVRWLQAISKFNGTISGGPNFAYQLCADQVTEEDMATLDLSSWRVAYSGSEKINLPTIEKFLQKFSRVRFSQNSFYPCYGMAESTLFVCGRYGVHSEAGGRFGDRYMSIGIPNEDTSILIVDVDEARLCGDREIGEIWVKSNSVAAGYYRDEHQTSLSFGARIADQIGYLRTGDLGFMDKNSLYYVGRLKNLVKIRGTNYYAEDLEEKVSQAVAQLGVARVAAFSIEQLGEEALIFLLEANRSLAEYQHSAQVVQQTQTVVCDAFGIVPKKVVPVGRGELPLTTSGKLQRNVCRERFLSGHYSSNVEARPS